MISVDDYPVYKKYFYVVNFRDLTKVRLIPFYYVNIEAAKRSIKTIRKSRRKYYRAMRGNDVQEYFLYYRMTGNKISFKKYDYPDDVVIDKELRRLFRIRQRRRLRRMGLYTRLRVSRSIKKKPPIIKAVKNTQKVSTSPRTTARVIRLERKPKKYWYLILYHQLSKKKGKLFKINALKYNQETGELKRIVFHTFRTDMMIPYLITTLETLIYEAIQKGLQTKEYYQQFGFGLA